MLALDAALALAITALAKPSETITATSLAATTLSAATLSAANTPEDCGAHADGQR